MIRVSDLRCNDTKNEIGTVDPIFSWILESDERFVKQKKYQLQISMDNSFSSVIWNFMRYSEKTTDIHYSGPQLESKTRYYVRVKSWISKNVCTNWSEPIFFETPIFSEDEWRADWIRPNKIELTGDKRYRRPYIAEKKFQAKGMVKKARIYVSCLGLYEVKINDTKISHDYFRPGFTDYNYRVQFQSYDITKLIKENNKISITVAEGWYSGYLFTEGRKDFFGNVNAVIAQIELTYDDGTVDIFGTNETWTQRFGKIMYSDLYNGEFYDDNQIEKNAGHMVNYPYTKKTLVAQNGPSVAKVLEVNPVNIFKDHNNDLILDMGQNMVGWLAFRNTHVSAEKVILHHGEVLDKDGNFYNDNLRTAEAKDTYIISGNEEKIYQPHFTFHGFRYVKLEGFSDEVEISDFKGIVLSSNTDQTSEFRTGNSLINQLQSNIVWGERSNFFDIPTDCPQRDERLGWTADAQIFMPTASFNMNIDTTIKRWLKDFKPEQNEQNGAVPLVVPDILKGESGDIIANTTAAWGDAATVIPWVLYEYFDDVSVLSQQYESMKNWVDYVRRQGTSEYLWDTDLQLADWVALDSPEDSYHGETDGGLVATAYFARSTDILARTAKVLGNMIDYKEYCELLLNIKKSFQNRYLESDGFTVSSKTQTAYILSVHFDLIDEEKKQAAVDQLVKLIHENNDHLNTGFLGTPYISHVLSDYGHEDLAYRLLFNEDFPSWLYQVRHGATTMWEHWDGIKKDGSFWSPDMNSFNHYAYGSIGDWMYQNIGGIRLKRPGFKKFIIAPKPNKEIGEADCTFNSKHGKIKSSWKLTDSKLSLTINIPANTEALVILPEPKDKEAVKKSVIEVSEGMAYFTNGKGKPDVISFDNLEFVKTEPFDEKNVIVSERDLGFELGSGEFHFEYKMN